MIGHQMEDGFCARTPRLSPKVPGASSGDRGDLLRDMKGGGCTEYCKATLALEKARRQCLKELRELQGGGGGGNR